MAYDALQTWHDGLKMSVLGGKGVVLVILEIFLTLPTGRQAQRTESMAQRTQRAADGCRYELAGGGNRLKERGQRMRKSLWHPLYSRNWLNDADYLHKWG